MLRRSPRLDSRFRGNDKCEGPLLLRPLLLLFTPSLHPSSRRIFNISDFFRLRVVPTSGAHSPAKVDAENLPGGTLVTVLAREGEETFELAPEEEAKLLAAIAEADRGETTTAPQVLNQIRRP